MLSCTEPLYAASFDASLATSESTSLPHPGRRVVLRPSATPWLAALVNDSRLTPCACLGPRGFWASRVREICMHGLKRAEAVEQSAPPLLDWLLRSPSLRYRIQRKFPTTE